MAELVAGFGVPHNPHFPGWVADGAPAAEEIARMYGGVAEHLRRVRPDVLLFFTGDHYNIFFEECVPIFSIGVAESANGASDYPELRRRRVPIAADLARHIHVETVRAGFDIGMSQEFDFDHTVIAPLHFLVPDGSVPVVPVFVNALIPPLPSSSRCLALGSAIAAAVRTAPGDARVAAVASGSFSLEIGGPRISETSHTGVPAPQWVGRVLALLRDGAIAQLRRRGHRGAPRARRQRGRRAARVDRDAGHDRGAAAGLPRCAADVRARVRRLAGVSVYTVNKLCRRVVHEPDLRAALAADPEPALRTAIPPLSEEEIAALLAGDVGRLSRMGANHFLLHQLGRWKVLGLDLPTYAERIRAAWR